MTTPTTTHTTIQDTAKPTTASADTAKATTTQAKAPALLSIGCCNKIRSHRQPTELTKHLVRQCKNVKNGIKILVLKCKFSKMQFSLLKSSQ